MRLLAALVAMAAVAEHSGRAAAAAVAQQWVVDAVRGDDGATGLTASSAFRSLSRARAAVADWQAARRADGAAQGGELRVLLRAGDYGPLHLGAAHGGATADSPVVYAAWPGDNAVVSAGLRVPASAIHRVPHPAGGQGPVLHVALAELGLSPADYGHLRGENSTDQYIYGFDNFTSSGHPEAAFVPGCANQKMEVHVRGNTALALAKYPNPWSNGTWQWMYVNRSKPLGNASFRLATEDLSRSAAWATERDPWVHGYFFADWADTIARVAGIAGGVVQLDKNMVSETNRQNKSSPLRPKARWVGMNLLSELDDTDRGEYYIDRNTGDLWLIPPGGVSTTDSPAELDLVVSVNSTCIDSNASNVRFEGLHVQYSTGNGMVLRGDNIAVVNCSVSNMGAMGISIDGVNNTIDGCHVHDVGCAALGVHSGSRNASLLPGNAVISNNVLHKFGQWKRMYQPGIVFDSVGDRYVGNTIYDAPHSGMLGHSCDLTVDGNNFTQLCTESGDAGAFYTGRSWADRGNSIVNNHFERIRNFGKAISLQAQNVHCIHFDDQMSG